MRMLWQMQFSRVTCHPHRRRPRAEAEENHVSGSQTENRSGSVSTVRQGEEGGVKRAE
jgi:hypothetical protein